TRVSTRSSGTSDTSTQREYFRREAKKCTRRALPLRNRTSTCPKSSCENSPGSPSIPPLPAELHGGCPTPRCGGLGAARVFGRDRSEFSEPAVWFVLTFSR